MKVYIETYGCQANIADSEQMAGLLNKEHEIVDNLEDSEVVLVNTCAVKLRTQNKILNFIKNIPDDKKVLVGGCLPKVYDVRKAGKVDAVFDTNSVLKVNELIKDNNDANKKEKEYRINLERIRKDKNVGIINIEQGCTSKCTFCGTVLARGSLKSYRIGDVKREAEKAIKDGCKKIYLTGQDTGAYGLDIKSSLPELIKEISSIKGDYKIRVGMMNPWHAKRILKWLIEAYKNEKVMKFLHIPVQSGSEKVLKDMKRFHTVVDFVSIVEKFREEFDMTISTDIIVGFPTEDEEDFEETVNLIRKIRLEVVNISKFSPREGTEAAKMKQLPSEVIKERSRRLTEEYNKVKLVNMPITHY